MTECLRTMESNCKNCYKCIRNCPVKSIAFADNQAKILSEDCILCGHCYLICPQNAKQIRSDTERARALIASGAPVIACVAPSFIANFGVKSIGAMDKALRKLGFASAEDTAMGATAVKRQYEDMLRKKEHPVLISSCCPSVNKLIRRYYPEALQYLAPVLSPMQAHSVLVKERIPGAKTVFIGPCISKKAEADESDGRVDCVLTFEELAKWLEEESIVLEEPEESGAPGAGGGRGNFFPAPGGIIRSMHTEKTGYDYISVDGVENCMEALREIIRGGLRQCFVEMSACQGGCIGGPVMNPERRAGRIAGTLRVGKYARETELPVRSMSREELSTSYSFLGDDHPVLPGETEIRRVLARMGKASPEQELNCGSCGYDTCREKAIAVCLGKADLNMCLPYLKEKAESFSEKIVSNTPNAILVMDEELNIQLVNATACQLFGLKSPMEIRGAPVVRLLDPVDYLAVTRARKNIYDRKRYLDRYDRYVEETIIFDRDYHILISFLRDVTDQEKNRTEKEERGREAVEITDKVIEKQMRVVQEIASLLGETTAETQVALTRLKGTLSK
ncbi:[Fe-Fe] hydrogenase large subunit C-terminal domain-containing protein [Papillibacter cinnamivorans]|uniref:PAS domain S-box-containing protein n=1 Tax=Papillibacter cinnamivorans DSM 12816 TaxID=1122930 RepID=A0A1W2BAF5_9FIRM|nr:[Fe-Fe] hydrogenase large subunit C-terminal domain-containing protein [Papillibacter cinnamivorans]SMC69771.1 PAS domain S-box-containing protein [Papillibacter cinnamivorans DSM 12816]